MLTEIPDSVSVAVVHPLFYLCSNISVDYITAKFNDLQIWCDHLLLHFELNFNESALDRRDYVA